MRLLTVTAQGKQGAVLSEPQSGSQKALGLQVTHRATEYSSKMKELDTRSWQLDHCEQYHQSG